MTIRLPTEVRFWLVSGGWRTALVASRWVILGLIAAGHLFTLNPALVRADPFVDLLALITIVACALLLSQLGGPLRRTLWVWIILFIFLVGYYAKIYVVSRVAGTSGIKSIDPELSWVDLHVIAGSYYWTTLAFVVFCAVAWFALWRLPTTLPIPSTIVAPRLPPTIAGLTMIGLAFIGLFLTWLQWKLQIGILGVPYSRLPWRLDTMIFRLRGDVIPTVLLFFVWATDRSKLPWLRGLCVASLAIVAFAGAIVTTSRGELVLMTLLLAVMWMLMGRLGWPRLVLLGGFGAAAILMTPILTSIRLAEMRVPPAISMPPTPAASQPPSPNASATATASTVPVSPKTVALGSIGVLENTLSHFAVRVQGADGVWYASRHLPPLGSLGRLSHLVVDQLNTYYTREFVGVRRPGDYRAPGIVGAFMILGGLPGLVMLLAVYVTILGLAWRYCSTVAIAPLALALLAIFILRFTTDGTLLYQDVVALALSVAGCLALNRLTARLAASHQMVSAPPSGAHLPPIPQKGMG